MLLLMILPVLSLPFVTPAAAAVFRDPTKSVVFVIVTSGRINGPSVFSDLEPSFDSSSSRSIWGDEGGEEGYQQMVQL